MIATAVELCLCILLFNHDIILRSWRPPESKIVDCVQCLVHNLINFSIIKCAFEFWESGTMISYTVLCMGQGHVCFFLFSPPFLMGYIFDYFWWVTVLTTFDGLHFWLLLMGYSFDYFWWVTVLTTFGGLQFWLLLMGYTFDYFWWVSFDCFWWVTFLTTFDGLQFRLLLTGFVCIRFGYGFVLTFLKAGSTVAWLEYMQFFLFLFLTRMKKLCFRRWSENFDLFFLPQGTFFLMFLEWKEMLH